MASIPTTTFNARNGHEFAIRTARPDDAGAALAYIRPIAEETEFFVIEADEFPATVEEEQAWIQDHVDDPGKILLLAEADGCLIGNISFEAGPFRRIAHRGTLGIAVVKEWRGLGVGTALLETFLMWAQSSPMIEKVCLDVFDSNSQAIRLYRKLGFVEEGRRERDIRRGPGDYVDTVTMGRFVN